MEKENPSENRQPNGIQSFLWGITGADSELLNKSPKGDQIKYSGIGGLILFTSLLAALSGGYAVQSTIQNLPASILLGIGWGLVILNINRLIFSTIRRNTGRPTQKLTFALPRIILSIAIVVVIVRPLELKIFESQIDKLVAEERVNIKQKLSESQDSIPALSELEINEVATKSTEGFIGRLIVYEKYKKENPIGSESPVSLISMGLMLFFIIVDILPLMMWILSPAGTYEKLLAEKEDKIYNKKTLKKELKSEGVINELKPEITNKESEDLIATTKRKEEKVENIIVEEKIPLTFESYFNQITDRIDKEIYLLREKSGKLLNQGLFIIFIGIFLYAGMLFIWLTIFQDKGFQTYHIYGIVSTSLLFLFFEFLGGWFLKQHRVALHSSMYLGKFKPNIERYLLTYLAIKELGHEEKSKEFLNSLIDLLKKDLLYPDNKILVTTDSSFAKEAVDALNSFKGTALSQGK